MRLILIVLILFTCISRSSGAYSKEPDSRHLVVFIGSSSVKRWITLQRDFPAFHTVNLGFNGEMIAGISDQINARLTKLNPSRIVIYAGENDLWGNDEREHAKTTAKVCIEYRQLVKKIHHILPKTRIVGVSIKLSPRRIKLRREIVATNKCIRGIARHSYFRYADVYAAMLGARGKPNKSLFSGDGLHMNGRGYEIWNILIDNLL